MNYEVEVLPVAIGAVVLTIATLIIGLGIIMMKRVNESIKRASDAIDEEYSCCDGFETGCECCGCEETRRG